MSANRCDGLTREQRAARRADVIWRWVGIALCAVSAIATYSALSAIWR